MIFLWEVEWEEWDKNFISIFENNLFFVDQVVFAEILLKARISHFSIGS